MSMTVKCARWFGTDDVDDAASDNQQNPTATDPHRLTATSRRTDHFPNGFIISFITNWQTYNQSPEAEEGRRFWAMAGETLGSLLFRPLKLRWRSPASRVSTHWVCTPCAQQSKKIVKPSNWVCNQAGVHERDRVCVSECKRDDDRRGWRFFLGHGLCGDDCPRQHERGKNLRSMWAG